MVNLDDLLSRADDEILEQLLGQDALRLLRLLDAELSRPARLRDLVRPLYGDAALVGESRLRRLLFQVLRPHEARAIGSLIGRSRGRASVPVD